MVRTNKSISFCNKRTNSIDAFIFTSASKNSYRSHWTNEKRERKRELSTRSDKFRMVIDRKINYYLQLYTSNWHTFFGVIFSYDFGIGIRFPLVIFTMRIQFNPIDWFLYHCWFVFPFSSISLSTNAAKMQNVYTEPWNRQELFLTCQFLYAYLYMCAFVSVNVQFNDLHLIDFQKSCIWMCSCKWPFVVQSLILWLFCVFLSIGCRQNFDQRFSYNNKTATLLALVYLNDDLRVCDGIESCNGKDNRVYLNIPLTSIFAAGLFHHIENSIGQWLWWAASPINELLSHLALALH